MTFQILLPFFDDDTTLRVVHIFLADPNGDNHPDAYQVTNQMHRIAFNDGTGNFTSSREVFMRNYALELGDLNGNGQLDAILIHFEHGEMGGELIVECAELPSQIVTPTRPKGAPDQVFAIQDMNRDGIPEDFVAGCCGGGTTMINCATPASNRRPCLGSERPMAAALGDLNGDGSLDIFLVNGWVRVNGRNQSSTPNEVWFNDGLGNFIDSGQRLGDSVGYAVALGDLNADRSLDAVVGNRRGIEIWFNDGSGRFAKGQQRFGIDTTHTIFVADVDSDHDLDLFLGGDSSIRVWLNDGAGQFESGQRIAFGHRETVSVGDVTGDGFVDIFVGGPDTYQVWRGNGDGRFNAGAITAYR